MKAKDLILIALVCANVTLAAVALAVYVGRAEPAAMAVDSDRHGDFIMATGPISSGREAVLVIDVVAKRANLYVPKAGAASNSKFELKSSRNLAVDFAPGVGAGATKRP
jgi:hypothetical protein